MFPNFTKSIFKLVFFYYENIINDCKNIIFLYHFNENFIDKEWNLIITKRIFRNVYNSYFKFANDFLLHPEYLSYFDQMIQKIVSFLFSTLKPHLNNSSYSSFFFLIVAVFSDATLSL